MIPIGRVPVVLRIGTLNEESRQYLYGIQRALDLRWPHDLRRNTRCLEVAYWTVLDDTPTEIAERLHCDTNTVRRDMRRLGELLDPPSARPKPGG